MKTLETNAGEKYSRAEQKNEVEHKNKTKGLILHRSEFRRAKSK
jgi:hypothetical protein